jgi:hypothetical protein
MKTVVLALLVAVVGPALAQEKPVPKDSERIFVPGCSKGRVFVVGPREKDQPGRTDLEPGTRLRMSGKGGLLDEIKKMEGSLIEITGLVRKADLEPAGVSLGGGVRVAPAMPPSSGSVGRTANMNQIVIDVEGWRPMDGRCP